MFKGIHETFRWLADGLVQAWTDIEERLRPRHRLQFVRTGEGYVLQRPDGERLAEGLPLDDASADIPTNVRTLVKDSDVDVVLPADELLIRTLEPLPSQSRPYVDGIVRHQLERLTPWRASDVLYTYQIASAGAEDSRLVVTLSATARSLHRRLLDALSDLGPRNVRLIYDQAYAGKDIAISVTGNAASVARQEKIRWRIGATAAAFGAASLAAIVLLVMAWQNTDATLEAVERDVASLRAKLAASGPTVAAGDRDVEAILKRRLNTPVSVLAIEALSGTLPDDTYLTELRIAEGRIRLTGVSRSVARLVPLLEASPAFAEPTFFAPTTRLPNNQGDRFHLDARVVPPGAPKP